MGPEQLIFFDFL